MARASTPRLRVAALALAGIVTAGLALGALVARPDAGAPGTGRSLAPPTAGAPATGPAPAGHAPEMAFLGDSLTVGVGAPPGRGLAPVTAELLGWPTALVDGVSGSGFLAPGAGRPLTDRVGDVIDAAPDVVVVAAGTNDAGRGYPPADVGAAASQVLRELRAGLPDATLVVLGPFPTSADAVEADDPVRDAVRDAAQTEGAEFVDARELLASPGVDLERWDDYISGDGLHPNERGYALLADALAERVRSAVLDPAASGGR